MKERKTVSAVEYLSKAQGRFGNDPADWRFVCPCCGRVNSGSEFKKAKATPNDMYQNCIGRFDRSKGCDYAAYGLFDICAVQIQFKDGTTCSAFEIADASWEPGSIHKEGDN